MMMASHVFKSLAVFAVFGALISLSGTVHAASTLENSGIVPKPVTVKSAPGRFAVSPSTVIVVPDGSAELFDIGRYFSAVVNDIANYCLEVRTRSQGAGAGNTVTLSVGGMGDLGDEGYTLNITNDTVTITAPKPAGIFYGIQTIRQLLLSSTLDNTEAMTIPAGSITDKPSYKWRGFQLDCSRHFMPLDYVKQCIDVLALHKMNVFHWHLTDDQGWRIEIKKYPKLTETGAWRGEGEDRHGGWYTQEEALEIVGYARRRYITVVPEIEMPGHATAAIAAYPELSCDGKKIEVETTWGIHTNLFCAGKESTFEFLENVLREVYEIFPSQYIHIGGDEAKKDKWEVCPYCQKRIKDEGLEDEAELQGYFTRRIDAFVQTLGRSIVGWDEILEGDPSRTTIVQSWRGMEGAIEGAKNGHYVISSPSTHVYLDFPNVDEGLHDIGWLKETTIEKTYSFNPTPAELSDAEKSYILGGEAPMWTERTPYPEVDNNVFPRLTALSEVVWTPAELRNWPDFSKRLEIHLARLDMLGVDYYKPSTKVGSWEGSQLSGSFAALEWDVTEYMKPGHFRFTVRHDSGANDVLIRRVSLIENGREIASDTHDGVTGKRDRAHNYRLDLFTVNEGATYTLRAEMRGDGGSDARGSIMMRAFGN